MNVLLDTSVLIADERDLWDGGRFLREAVADGSVAMSAISATEFLQGVYRAEAGRRRERRKAFFESLLASLEVIPFGLEEARTHARLAADLARLGVGIGGYDLIIAATCLHLDWSLATLNTAEFARIPGLNLAPTEPFLIPAP